jgi:hypothetical protein
MSGPRGRANTLVYTSWSICLTISHPFATS